MNKKCVIFGDTVCGLYNVNLTTMLGQTTIISFKFFTSFFKLYFLLYAVTIERKTVKKIIVLNSGTNAI